MERPLAWCKWSVFYNKTNKDQFQECHQECKSTSECTDFTWHSPAAEIFPSSCFLFSSCDHLEYSHGCFSGQFSLQYYKSTHLW